MHAFIVLFYLAVLIYSALVSATYFKIWLALVIAYILIFQGLLKPKFPFRQAITIASWGEPSEPYSILRTQLTVDKAKAYLKKLNKETEGEEGRTIVTFYHFMVYGISHVLAAAEKGIGRLALGSFYKHHSRLGMTLLIQSREGVRYVTVWNLHKKTLR